jgi:Kef-type K+ transport system membrane component KefB
MHNNLWLYSAVILFLVVVSKIISSKTSTVDVLWLIVFGSVGVNLGLLPQENIILESIGEWGIIFVMFALGFDEDFGHFIQGLKRSMGIAIFGAIFPFMAGFYVAGYFGYDFNSQMIWGLTMTATAVSLTMVSLKEENLHKTTASTAIMTAAIIDDILSLIGLSILIPIILATNDNGSTSIDMFKIYIVIFKVIIFFAIIAFIGLILFPDSLENEKDKKHGTFFTLAIKIRQFTGIRKLLTTQNGKLTPLIMLFIALTFGAIADKFGFHPAIGAYFAGLFLKGEYFNVTANNNLKSHKEEAKFVIDHLAFTIFGPIFFVMLGTKLIFELDILIKIIIPVLSLFSFVFVFQILSASISAKYTGRYKWYQSIMIGFGMLGRAELAFIVINIAYTQNHIINFEQFYILIATLFLLNISVPLAIKWWKPYYLGKKHLKIFGTVISKR